MTNILHAEDSSISSVRIATTQDGKPITFKPTVRLIGEVSINNIISRINSHHEHVLYI